MRRQKDEYEKDDDSLPQEKCVPDHDDRFIHRCRVRLYEDNQLYILSSIYLLNIRRLYDFFFLNTYSLMLDSREKERKKKEEQYCYASVSTVKKERKMSSVSYCRREEYNLMKTRSQFGTSSLENICG